MKEKERKKTSKQIIIIMIIIMLCNFIVPTCAYAETDTEGGGTYFDYLVKFIAFLCDSVMQFMQNSFTSNHSIDNGNGTYDFQYSPAIIFSGTVMGLDINFIVPNTDVRNTNNFESYVREKREEYFKIVKDNGVDPDYWTDANYQNEIKDLKEYKMTYYEVPVGIYHIDNIHACEMYYLEKDGTLYTKYIFKTWDIHDAPRIESYTPEPIPITPEFLDEMNTMVCYTSIANELQPTIATWYNALRRIALVGLLSVLVYLGIRIIISSSSAEGNSKYKKMLTDWLIALCLLFTLHYIMSATLVITKSLSSVFSLGTTDELLNTLRRDINSSETWGEALSELIMYIVLVIYTVVFTFQYLRRVLYMAFFTMMAPLITLTYPIDKVNDGQAQAFNMWIREYIFNALIQVIHLVVYYTIVGSAIELVKSFPLYGIVAIGFLTQGEKAIRSMFRFNNAETVGTMGAIAVGGLVTTAMNKLKSVATKSAKGATGDKSEGKAGSGESSNGKVRTATKNPLSGAQGNGSTSGNQSNGGFSGVQGKEISSEKGGELQSSSSGDSKPKRTISGSGVRALGGKFIKTAGGTALDVLTGGTGAIIGFAAGVAQGDVGAAFTGALAGGAAGKHLGRRAVQLPGDVIGGVKTGWGNLKDTYREGAYGAEAAEAIKFDEEFRKGSTYKALQSNPNFSEESVQAMLDEGITDKKAMTAILDSGMDVEDAIKYYTLAQNCPPEIFYDKKNLKTFCKELRKKDEIFEGQSYGKIRDMMTKFM